MQTIDVIEDMVVRDGGTIVYKDRHNRQYFIPAPLYNDDSIYCAYPYHHTKSDEYRDNIRITNIQLNIVEKFSNE